MGADNRDWYRNWWRKRSGYIERARFRMGHSEYKNAQLERRLSATRSAWRRNLFVAFCVVGVLVLLAVLRS